MTKGVVISVTNRTWTPGSHSFESSLDSKRYDKFLKYVAFFLKDELIRAIDNQRYKSKWAALSPKYLDYKMRNNLSLNIWEATGTMKKSIKVFKRGEYYVVGFKKTDIYVKHGVQINKVARWLEYGVPDNNLPPRPLFGRLQEYLRKNIGDVYKRFVRDNPI